MKPLHGIERLRRMRETRGLGDMVAVVAQPIAAWIDKALGTHVKTCQSCEKRRKAMNRIHF